MRECISAPSIYKEVNMRAFGFVEPYRSSKEFGEIIKEASDRGLIIAELLKIKTEIDASYAVYVPFFDERLVIKSDVIQILDKHISELKGE